MQQDWELIRRRATRSIISLGVKISIVVVLVCFVAAIWPMEDYPPLMCLDVVDLRDASHPIEVSLLVQNADRWPVQVHGVELFSGGGWGEYSMVGWLPTEEDAEPLVAGSPSKSVQQNTSDVSIPGTESALLVLRLQPGHSVGQPILRIHYRTVFWIPYSLDIPLQNEGIASR